MTAVSKTKGNELSCKDSYPHNSVLQLEMVNLKLKRNSFRKQNKSKATLLLHSFPSDCCYCTKVSLAASRS